MTSEERERMNLLCMRIQEEKDHQHFEELLRELDEVIARKQRRFPKDDGVLTLRGRTRPWQTTSGLVRKLVTGAYRNNAEHLEITIPEAEDLFREIRIANAFTDLDGQPVALRDQARVDIAFEADTKDTIRREAPGPEIAGERLPFLEPS